MDSKGSSWGAALFSGILLVVMFGCLLPIFLDYHKRSNIHKALLFIGAIIAAGWLVLSLPQVWKLVLASAAPLLVFVYVLLARKRKKP